MTPTEYLDAAKAVMNITSDNELAQRLGTTRQRISAYRLGQQHISAEAAFKIAITLNQDPALVFADLESQREKNPKRAEFWRSFLSRAAMVAMIASTLALCFSGNCDTGPGPLGGLIAASAAFFYAFWVRIICDYDCSHLSYRGKSLQKIMANGRCIAPSRLAVKT